jgi:dolichol-phosphate mannosyltransferase
LPELLCATEHVDVAIGSRYMDRGAIEGWPWYRRVISRSMNHVSRALLDLPIHDLSGAFRAYRVAKLRQIDLDKIAASGYAYLEEILWHLNRAGASFAEVPINFQQRRAGKSKINFREAAAKIVTLIRLGARS